MLKLFNLKTLKNVHDGKEYDFVAACFEWRVKIANKLGIVESEANDGEIAAFIAYALAFPESFVALVDTYNVLR